MKNNFFLNLKSEFSFSFNTTFSCTLKSAIIMYIYINVCKYIIIERERFNYFINFYLYCIFMIVVFIFAGRNKMCRQFYC